MIATAEIANEFDYGQLSDIDRAFVLRETLEIKSRLRSSAESIIAIGEKLIAIKEVLRHGKWCQWLKSEFEWDERTAQRFMNVAKRLPKSDTVSDLDKFATSALYMLTQPSIPDSAIKEAIDRASQGEQIQKSTAQEIVDSHKPRSAPSAPPPAKYSLNQTVWCLIEGFSGIEMQVVAVKSRSASQWMYECKFVGEDGLNHYRSFYESALCDRPETPIEGELGVFDNQSPRASQSVEEERGDIVDIASTARIHVLEEQKKELEEQFNASDELLFKLYEACRKLPKEYKDMVFLGGLDEEIEEWLNGESD